MVGAAAQRPQAGARRVEQHAVEGARRPRRRPPVGDEHFDAAYASGLRLTAAEAASRADPARRTSRRRACLTERELEAYLAARETVRRLKQAAETGSPPRAVN